MSAGMRHLILFDHSGCDDTGPEEDRCCVAKIAAVVCESGPTATCRFGCPCDETSCEMGWQECTGGEVTCLRNRKEHEGWIDEEDDAAIPPHPAERHCEFGHRLVEHECWIIDQLAGAHEPSYVFDLAPSAWVDGPVDVTEWSEDGVIVEYAADHPLADAGSVSDAGVPL